MNKLHTKPITVGELEHLRDTLNILYSHTMDNEELLLPDMIEAQDTYATAKQMIEKILEFEETEEDRERQFAIDKVINTEKGIW